MPQGLPRKIRVAFILQALLASVVISLGLLGSGLLIRHLVMIDRMHQEVAHFWAGRAVDPAYPLPNTATMRGYLETAKARDPALPDALRGVPPGLHDANGNSGQPRALFVDKRPAGTLYIILTTTLLDRAIMMTGVAALILALLAIYFVSWLTYRTSMRLVAPVGWLANVVAHWDPRDPDPGAVKSDNLPAESSSEVRQLARALSGLAGRVGEFVGRERDFTRDASHELRTPLTVIRVASDLMLADPETTARARRSLSRIQRAGRDMEAVIDAFLILAREAEQAPLREPFDVLEIIHEEMDRVRPLLADKPIDLTLVEDGVPRLTVPPQVLKLMLGNLLENAVRFTDEGKIELRVACDCIEVRDSGIGMSPETIAKAFDPFYRADISRPESKGMGLSIVRRLGDRFGWPVTLTSSPGHGTTAVIRFAQ